MSYICMYVFKFTQLNKITMQVSIPYRSQLSPLKREDALQGIHAVLAATWLENPET